MLAEGATNGDISRQPANWKKGTYNIRVIHLCCGVLGPLESHPFRVQFSAERMFNWNESHNRIVGHKFSVQTPLAGQHAKPQIGIPLRYYAVFVRLLPWPAGPM